MTYDLYEFVPITGAWLESLGTNDYDTAVKLIEASGYEVVERCLADACEIISNNTDSYEEAIEMIREDCDRYYPLSEYTVSKQIDIYNQYLESLGKPFIRTTEAQMILHKLPDMVADDLRVRKEIDTTDEQTRRANISGYLCALASANLINTYEKIELLNWFMS